MEQCPSWEANSHSASQEILHLFRGPATGMYPEPDASTPHLTILLP